MKASCYYEIQDRDEEKRRNSVRIIESTVKIPLRRPDLKSLVILDTDDRQPIV
jgi:hypothetical protein